MKTSTRTARVNEASTRFCLRGWRFLPFLAGALLFAGQAVSAGEGGPIQPLANDFVTVGESPDPQHIPLYTPSILRLPSGRLLAAYERGGSKSIALILSSDDQGKTWVQRGALRIVHGRLFQAGGKIYYLGQKGDLQIAISLDEGMTWSEPRALTSGQRWHQSACNVWHARGQVYLVMERRTSDEIKGWPVGALAPVLMRAAEDSDLTRRENWTFASELVFADLMRGYRQNELETDFFGVPFYTLNYPKPTLVGDKRAVGPMGWLETNVVEILDPRHLWFDPTGHTLHLFMRAHTGGTGYAALAKVVENADGTMTTRLETVPSGKKILYLPFPGGQMRFHVCYDEKTKLYWLLGSQAIDSMTRPEALPQERYGLPNNERHRLVLHFSKNMVDWCFAGVVAIGNSPKEARHYASMDIDGDDLVVLSRSGDIQAKSAHDGNLITFHRIRKFRDLVY